MNKMNETPNKMQNYLIMWKKGKNLILKWTELLTQITVCYANKKKHLKRNTKVWKLKLINQINIINLLEIWDVQIEDCVWTLSVSLSTMMSLLFVVHVVPFKSKVTPHSLDRKQILDSLLLRASKCNKIEHCCLDFITMHVQWFRLRCGTVGVYIEQKKDSMETGTMLGNVSIKICVRFLNLNSNAFTFWFEYTYF